VRALPGQSSRLPPGPQPLAREAAAAEQRRRILRVTAELVAKRGYADTTTELIVRRAKVGYGTFYKFFPDKEACFLALFDETLERTAAALGEAYRSGEEDRGWPERLAAVIAALFELITTDPPLARACLVESLTAGPAIVGRYEAALGQLAALLARGRGEPGAPENLPDTLENTVAGGIMWIAYQRLIAGEAAQLPALLPEAVEFALTPYLGEEAAVAVAERQAPGALAEPA
jgi:AcrR family transcriptional regulator